ncbi:MAG: SAM-dependent chlorinase/fluorinase [Saprospiraceae bacterium]|nr:SAM-dependent chlorinase/fluorinase [Saprospiraceae bacterium]
MQIITLTSDFGHQDPYAAMVKGTCLRADPAIHCVDLTHEVLPFAVSQAAYFVLQSYRSFPEGSWHVVMVNLFYSAQPSLLLTCHHGHWFLVPDNGLLSLLFNPLPAKIFRVGTFNQGFRAVLDQVHHAITSWTAEPDPTGWSERVDHTEERLWLHPVTQKDWIRGNVIHVDRFENVVVNVHLTLFEEIGQGRPFRFHFRPHDVIERISSHYGDVSEGEPLLLFNAAGFLEIAVRTGNAASLLNLKMDDSVLIDFTPV